jgi:hypothetical protein
LAIKSVAEKFGTEVSHHIGRRREDVVLINGKAKLGVIIKVKYNKSADKQIYDKEYIDIFKGYDHIKRIKCVGINISEDKQKNKLEDKWVDIKYELKDNIQSSSPNQDLTTILSVNSVVSASNAIG